MLQAPGSRKVISNPITARGRLEISEPLQYKNYVFLGAAKLFQKLGVCLKSQLLEPGEWRTLIINSRCKYVAKGAKMWLQEPNFATVYFKFSLLLFKLFSNSRSFGAPLLGFFLLGARLHLSDPWCHMM